MIRFTTTGADFIVSSLSTFTFGQAFSIIEGNGGSYFVGGFLQRSLSDTNKYMSLTKISSTGNEEYSYLSLQTATYFYVR
jgi:hypothetical protein